MVVKQKFDIGDLVEIDVPYAKSSSKLLGLIVKAQLINPGTNTDQHLWHEDEYHCKIRILKKPPPQPDMTIEDSIWTNNETRWVRAKWLKQIAKA